MAANKDLQKTSLSLRLEIGVDDEGNTLYSSKTISNIKEGASADAIFAVVSAIKEVLNNNVTACYVNEQSLLQG